MEPILFSQLKNEVTFKLLFELMGKVRSFANLEESNWAKMVFQIPTALKGLIKNNDIDFKLLVKSTSSTCVTFLIKEMYDSKNGKSENTKGKS